jgi:hypothetical protein
MDNQDELTLWVLSQVVGGQKTYEEILFAYEIRINCDRSIANIALGQIVHKLISEGLIEYDADANGIIRSIRITSKGSGIVSGPV